MYLGSTVYRIHGTNQPSTIGKFVSSGCIGMLNEDVSDLFDRVKVGTRVVVLPGGPPAGDRHRLGAAGARTECRAAAAGVRRSRHPADRGAAAARAGDGALSRLEFRKARHSRCQALRLLEACVRTDSVREPLLVVSVVVKGACKPRHTVRDVITADAIDRRPRGRSSGMRRWIVGPNRLHYWWIRTGMPHIRTSNLSRAGRRSRPVTARFRWRGLTGDRAIPGMTGSRRFQLPDSYMTEIVLLSSASRTLVLTDLIENFEPARSATAVMRFLTWAGGVRDPTAARRAICE